MTHLRMVFMVAVVVVVAASAVSTTALACECKPDLSVAEHYSNAEAVFFGVAESVNHNSKYDTKRKFWEFAIQGIWKGPDQPRIRIYAYDPDGVQNSCDPHFKIGESYLIFARTLPGYPGRFQAGLCSGTVAGAGSLRALRVIGRPEHEYVTVE